MLTDTMQAGTPQQLAPITAVVSAKPNSDIVERKPKFELLSLPFAISIPVHDDTGKFQHSYKHTKMAAPRLISQGN